MVRLSPTKCEICIESIDFAGLETTDIVLVKHATSTKGEECIRLNKYETYTEDQITFFLLEVELRTGFTYHFVIYNGPERKEKYSSKDFILKGIHIFPIFK